MTDLRVRNRPPSPSVQLGAVVGYGIAAMLVAAACAPPDPPAPFKHETIYWQDDNGVEMVTCDECGLGSVTVQDDPYGTAAIALCAKCGGGEEVYGPIILDPAGEYDEDAEERASEARLAAEMEAAARAQAASDAAEAAEFERRLPCGSTRAAAASETAEADEAAANAEAYARAYCACDKHAAAREAARVARGAKRTCRRNVYGEKVRRAEFDWRPVVLCNYDFRKYIAHDGWSMRWLQPR